MEKITYLINTLNLVFYEILNIKALHNSSSGDLILYPCDIAALGNCIWKMVDSYCFEKYKEPNEIFLKYLNETEHKETIDWFKNVQVYDKSTTLEKFCADLLSRHFYSIKIDEEPKYKFYRESIKILNQRQSDNAIVLCVIIQLVALHLILGISQKKRIETYEKLFKCSYSGINELLKNDKPTTESGSKEEDIVVTIANKLFEHLINEKCSRAYIESWLFRISGNAYQSALIYDALIYKQNIDDKGIRSLDYMPGIVFYYLMQAEVNDAQKHMFGAQMENFYVLLDKLASSSVKEGNYGFGK